MRDHYRRHGVSGYILQLDIHGYYPNMSHRVVKEAFAAKLDPDTFIRVEDILDSQYDGDVGYNPGSQMIQIAGISVLDGFDHFCKERLRIHHYIRFMDDVVALFSDKDEAGMAFDEMTRYLTELEFEINDKKSGVRHINSGVMWLGFKYKLTVTGKVILTINPKNVKSQRKKLTRLVAKSKRGLLPRESVDNAYKCWRNHALKGNSYWLVKRMDTFYKELWRDETDNN